MNADDLKYAREALRNLRNKALTKAKEEPPKEAPKEEAAEEDEDAPPLASGQDTRAKVDALIASLQDESPDGDEVPYADGEEPEPEDEEEDEGEELRTYQLIGRKAPGPTIAEAMPKRGPGRPRKSA